jgi:uncharacterized protein YcbX
MARIAAIYRYPVKGLSAEALVAVDVAAGRTIPFDRAYAIENGPSSFDPSAPRHLPKTSFLTLMRNQRLASFQTAFDEGRHRLTITEGGALAAEGRLDTEPGRRAIESFLEGALAGELRGPLRVLSSPGHSFSDAADQVLSLINLASVRDLERHVGATVHPLRFRGNVYAADLPEWGELDWIGKLLAVGGLTAQVMARIDRCAATDVDPVTAVRDLRVPQTLLRAYGHADCGVYLRVVDGGRLAVGDVITVA